jgi:hypothetical protein
VDLPGAEGVELPGSWRTGGDGVPD